MSRRTGPDPVNPDPTDPDPTDPDPTDRVPRVTRTLRERFGLRALYPLQERVVRRLLAGHHALVVLPTGSGKSLCYQLPAVAREVPGVALVFSPLIALEKLAAIEPEATPGRYRFVRSPREGEIDPTELAEKRTRDLRRLLDMLELLRSGDIRAGVRGYFGLDG